jgi:hypothetical protein
MTKIVTRSFGVDVNKEEELKDTVKDLILRVEYKPPIVYFYIFKSLSSMRSYAVSEELKYGVSTWGLSEDFYAFHDAWTGAPRILYAAEALEILGEKAGLGCLRHEVGHAVLHGEIEYYIITQPLNSKILPETFYIITVAIKDLEVSNLLFKKGFIEDQLAFFKSIVYKEISSQRAIWPIVRENHKLAQIHLASLLKDLAFIFPFKACYEFQEEIEKVVSENLSHLPREVKASLVDLVSEIATLKLATLEKIREATRLFERKILFSII